MGNLVLKKWQEEAYQEWNNAGSKGIVEAVTGSGKSYLAMGCWQKLLEQNPNENIRTVVVVPNLTLLHQFAEKWVECFPEMRGKVGKFYGDQKDTFVNNHVIISTIQSMIPHGHNLLRRINQLNWKKLLIADECHRYIHGNHFRKIRIDFDWDYLLAITATLDREEYEIPGFGRPVYEYTFADAIRDGLVNEFTIINCALELSSSELRDYNELTDNISEQISYVKECYSGVIIDLERDLFGTLKKYLEEHPDEISIKRLFGLIFRRATIWYTAEEKVAVASDLILDLVNKHKRKVLVFFERISSIVDMEENFILQDDAEHDEENIINLYTEPLKDKIDGWIGSMHSELDRNKRKEVLERFKECHQGVLFACKMLDEGWDVPEIDAAILVSSSKSKTQRIQRIGRTLRKSEKKSLIITLHLPQTKEVDVIINDEDLFRGAAEIHTCTRDDIFGLVEELESTVAGENGDSPVEDEPEISIDDNLYRIRSNHWAYQFDLYLPLGEENFIVLLELAKDPNGSVPYRIEEPYQSKLRRVIDTKFQEPKRIRLNFKASGLLDVGAFVIPVGEELDFIHKIPKYFYAFIYWEGDDLILWEREGADSKYLWSRHSWKELEVV